MNKMFVTVGLYENCIFPYIYELLTAGLVIFLVLGLTKNRYQGCKSFRHLLEAILQKCHSLCDRSYELNRINHERHDANNLNYISKLQKIISPLFGSIETKYILRETNALFCLLTVITGCVLNMMTPIYSDKIVESLSTHAYSYSYSEPTSKTVPNSTIPSLPSLPSSPPEVQVAFRWDLILIYIFLRLFQGRGTTLSLLNCIQNYLWISFDQYVTREVQVKFFEHLHRLSLGWHSDRKTGEILGALERGTEGLLTILEHLIFSIIPTVLDITIAIIYLSSRFNTWFGLIVLTQIILYFLATFYGTKKKSDFQRDMNCAENVQRQMAIESMLNFETVKFYANETYESQKFESAIYNFQRKQKTVLKYTYLIECFQIIIINAGLLLSSLLCAWLVVRDRRLTVGDYVLLTTYLSQLYGPLNFLGRYYRILQYNLTAMEQMLKIFEEEPVVRDKSNATDLVVTNGSVEFRNVSFGYKSKKILDNVSFVINEGESVALVGASGSGKTSIIRLLFRLYDPSSGEILVDGVNIMNVTQSSLRYAIGIVPQDTAVFADSIKNNIRYGKINANFEETQHAAQKACLHDKITSLPDGYETMIGERGANLSGGERQRLSISRILLKNPKIILLDEATSALDGHTETKIQASFQKLCQGRTSLVVTHRLSSITNVGKIIVLKNGHIVESGKHEELMNKNGEYSSMFKEQLTSNSHSENC